MTKWGYFIAYTKEISAEIVSDSVNQGMSTAGRMYASLYDWIVYKRGSKAKKKERKGKERKGKDKQ